MLINPSSKQKEIIEENIRMAKNINKLDCDYNTYPEFMKVVCDFIMTAVILTSLLLVVAKLCGTL